ncbi:MASE1 domain-containing protein [Scandinavium sp. H11S7]|uniref:MASE1 domain-containing protein n=1 Tax=Scandinavium hiltneri TaxID=2926519 RepID=UPI0021655EE1|nr:MASE1 domain-containing protein [Scandinavium hiltneri]MCS2157090.1 MASE1 domain-containing protein [Scandinavium hiltneri]
MARFLSPETVIDGNAIYLAWLPLCVILSMLLLFGRHAVLPLILAFTVTNTWFMSLPFRQHLVLVFCQLSKALALIRWLLSSVRQTIRTCG